LNTSGFSRLGFLSLGIALLGLSSATAYAQGAASQGLNANSAMSQLSAAFSGGKAVQRVQLSGNATWYAGSLEDSGTVTLTASADGSSLMQLILSASGQRSETQSGSGLNATCQWAGDDGIAHEIRSGSCWRQHSPFNRRSCPATLESLTSERELSVLAQMRIDIYKPS
jgi:hypothetical protein